MQGCGVRCADGPALCGYHARLTPAVVEAGDDQGAVDVVAQETHQHFLPDAGDELVATACCGGTLHDAQPAAVVAVGALRGEGVGLPVELDFDAAQCVGVELVGVLRAGLALWAHHDSTHMHLQAR